MRTQPIIRKVDAYAAQGRFILWLECSHKVSITRKEVEAVRDMLDRVEHAEVWPCPFCPVPAPPQKTAQQLWREAGQP